MTGGASADVISASYSERLSMGIEDVVDTWDATEPCPSARHVSAEWIERYYCIRRIGWDEVDDDIPASLT
jgi:hypothetical protein